MTQEVAVAGIAIGLSCSLLANLVTNISPGGMITPGWIALTAMAEPRRMYLVFASTALTFGVMWAARKGVILYGKRLFAATVLVSVVINAILVLILVDRYPYLFVGETLGFIVPGLIVYQVFRQPVTATFASLIVVTGLTYAVVQGGVLLSLIT